MDRRLTHINAQGRARMVDVSRKPHTDRVAVATGVIRMRPATLKKIRSRKIAKGDVLSAAQIAGVMGAKRTPEIIPMCHSILLAGVDLAFEEIVTPDSEGLCGVSITATTKSTGQTGVEMEALTAVAVAALTIYDMCKAVDREMIIDHVTLAMKMGGKSGRFERQKNP